MKANPWCFYCAQCDLHMRFSEEITDDQAEALRARMASGATSYTHTIDGVEHTLQVDRQATPLH